MVMNGRLMALVAVPAALVLSPGEFSSEAAEKPQTKPYPHYWLSIATTSQSIPGMPTGMSGIASLFGGGSSFGPRRELTLQLESPRSAGDAPAAQHLIPAGMKMGESLQLKTPKVEKAPLPQHEEHGQPGQYEKPRARMLIYWGCGDSIGKGQPRVIDTSKMNMAEFGTAFAGRTATRQTPPSARKGWTYGEWPDREERTTIPGEASLVGSHRIRGNYTVDIPFTLDARRDFMAPVEFSSLSRTAAGGVKVEWKQIPTAIGYFATAMGHNQNTGEMIFWSASEVPETGFGLLDYLTPSDVNRFIRDKVVLPAAVTSCTVPPVLRDAQGAMLQFIAYGEELNLVHPPKPKDPRQPWNIEWSVRARLKSTGMTPLAALDDESSDRSRRGKAKDGQHDDEGQEERPGGRPGGGIGDRLKGMFGL